VTKDVSAPRLQNAVTRAMNGTYKNFEKASADVRQHLKPILDMGLYDFARDLLADKGYGLEERDMIINPLSERSKTVLNKVPELKLLAGVYKVTGISKGQRQQVDPENIKSGLRDLKQADPNFSLVLARKIFEDKHYDWRSYKDALNEMVNSGEFDLTRDQKTQLGNLDSPPLSKLEKIFESANFIGR
jgi:hypothetical protein